MKETGKEDKFTMDTFDKTTGSDTASALHEGSNLDQDVDNILEGETSLSKKPQAVGKVYFVPSVLAYFIILLLITTGLLYHASTYL